MSKQQVCASCLDFSLDKVLKSREEMKPKWLLETDYVREFIHNNNNFRNCTPENSNVKLELDLGVKSIGRKILYWAANEKTKHNPSVSDAKKAYGKFNNSGISTVNKNGKVIFKFKCPQVYNTIAANSKIPKTYFRHLHFVVSNESKNEWLTQIYTKIVACKYGYTKAMSLHKTGLYVFINALPSEYYAKDHIPCSYNLHYKTIQKMSQKDLFSWFKDVVSLHYPKLYKYLKDKKLSISEIPIITYCAHSGCNASELSLEELMKKGFVNVNEFPGGIKEYRKNIPTDL